MAEAILDANAIAQWMGRTPEGWLHVLPTVDSTNDYAKMLALQNAPTGTAVLAEQQTKGRGRMGRSFQSPMGQGIYLSYLLRPRCQAEELMDLTCLVAVAVCQAMEETLDFRPGIKWINDLVWGGRKLAGILTEMSLEPESGLVRYCIVGIGINCSQSRQDVPPELQDIAVSLQTILDRPIHRERLVAAVLLALEKLDNLTPEERRAMMRRYRRDCVTIGKAVRVIRAGESRDGVALDMADDGALVVDFEGTVERVQSGEVSVRGFFGYADCGENG